MGRERRRSDASEISRRSMLRGTAAGLLCRLARSLPLGLGAAVVGWSREARASVVLNTLDFSNFNQIGGQAPIPGPSSVSFIDADTSDVSGLWASDPDAAAGGELDLVTRFQVKWATPNNADGGFRVIINDGVLKSAVAACA